MIYGLETLKIKTLYFLEDKGFIALDSNDSVTFLSRFYYVLWAVIAAAVLLPTFFAVTLAPDPPVAVREEVAERASTVEVSETTTNEITEATPAAPSQTDEAVIASSPISDTSRYAEPAAPAASAAGPVKLSRNGICHAPGTTYYNQTKRFTAYDSLDACLGAGGRMPKR